MKKEFGILFKENIEFKGKVFKRGYAYKIKDVLDAERLCRQGCIYAPKDAKYYSEEKKVVAPKKEHIDKVELKDTIKDEAKKNVVNKDIEQTKIQGKPSNKNKSSK